MTSQLARDEALNYALRADDTTSEIHELQADPNAADRSSRLNRLNRDAGLFLKLAELHATLAISEAIEALAFALRARDCEHVAVDHAIGACLDCGRDL